MPGLYGTPGIGEITFVDDTNAESTTMTTKAFQSNLWCNGVQRGATRIYIII